MIKFFFQIPLGRWKMGTHHCKDKKFYIHEFQKTLATQKDASLFTLTNVQAWKTTIPPNLTAMSESKDDLMCVCSVRGLYAPSHNEGSERGRFSSER
jgi:hypothetical protein